VLTALLLRWNRTRTGALETLYLDDVAPPQLDWPARQLASGEGRVPRELLLAVRERATFEIHHLRCVANERLSSARNRACLLQVLSEALGGRGSMAPLDMAPLEDFFKAWDEARQASASEVEAARIDKQGDWKNVVPSWA
jgi:hypothetical protein